MLVPARIRAVDVLTSVTRNGTRGHVRHPGDQGRRLRARPGDCRHLRRHLRAGHHRPDGHLDSPCRWGDRREPVRAVTATFSEALDPATVSASTFELRDPEQRPGRLPPSPTTRRRRTARLTPSAVPGRRHAVHARPSRAAPPTRPSATRRATRWRPARTWTFTTAAGRPARVTIWPTTAEPGEQVRAGSQRRRAGGEVPL